MGKKNKWSSIKLRELIFSYFGKQYLRYIFIGAIGFIATLMIIFFLSEFVFGRQNYLYAFVIGNLLNLIYSYITSVRYVFPVKSLSNERKIFFGTYNLVLIFAQTILVSQLVSIVGIDYYFFSSSFVTAVASIFGYFLFKSYVFKSNRQLQEL